jgi:heterodisulfide reductase subunit C
MEYGSMANSVASDRLTVSEDKSFKEEIEKLSGQNINSCYQCGECTAGCPVAYTADLAPNQVSRLVQLGQDDVLKSSMIWLCVGCETCATRCPRKVELSKVMDALRETAVKRGVASKERSVQTFHETFLRSVERGGRTHEISMLGEYKLRSLDLFSDIFLGAKMFLKGKLAIVPSLIKGRDEMKRIFGIRKR